MPGAEFLGGAAIGGDEETVGAAQLAADALLAAWTAGAADLSISRLAQGILGKDGGGAEG